MLETSRPATTAARAYRMFCGHQGSRFKLNTLPSSPSPAKLNKNMFTIPTRTAEIRTNAATSDLPVPPPVRLDILYLGLDPVLYGVRHDGFPKRASPLLALVFGHGQRLVDGVGLLVEVVGVDGQGVLAELLVGAGVLGEHEDAVPLVDDGGLLGDEVHAVADGVDEQDVVVLVRGDGAGEVVHHKELYRGPAVRAVLLVALPRRQAAGLQVRRVLGNVAAGGLELGQEGHVLPHLRVPLEHPAVGLEAADYVLGEVGPVHPQEELAWEPLYKLLLLEHGLAAGELPELGRVYGDGVGPPPHLASCVPHDTVPHVGLGAEDPGG